MPATVDYYLTPVSPWAYLGHDRFNQLLDATGALLHVRPADFGAIFAATGGLPLAKRSAQRQAYRLVELQRFSDQAGVPLIPQPAHFPVSGDAASKLIVAVREALGDRQALQLCGRIGRAIWHEQRNVGDEEVLLTLLREADLPADLLSVSTGAEVAAAYADGTAQALAAGVFGAPSYVVDGEIFWGQDRLDLLAQRLHGGR